MPLPDAFLGAVIGSVGTGFVGWILQKRKEIRQKERLEESLLAELDSMEGAFTVHEDEEGWVTYPQALPTEVYESNVASIGLLDQPALVIDFYSKLIALKSFAKTAEESDREDNYLGRVKDNYDHISERRREIQRQLSK